MSKTEQDYEVGYGKPPKATRFAAGQSGNPAGRPRGSKNLQTLLSEELEKKVDVVQNGEARRMSKGRIMVIKQVDRAISGNDRAFSTIVKLQGSGPAPSEPEAKWANDEVEPDYGAMLTDLIARRAQGGSDVEAPA